MSCYEFIISELQDDVSQKNSFALFFMNFEIIKSLIQKNRAKKINSMKNYLVILR